MFEKITSIAGSYPAIRKLGVFGSYSRGEQTRCSDLDLVIDYDENNIENYLDFIDTLEITLNIVVDCIPLYVLNRISKNQYEEEIKESILNDIIWLL